MSVATTLPVGLTCLAAVTAGSPIPVARSKTLSPGLISAIATNLSLTFWAPRSIVGHQISHPLATLSHICRCCALNCSALNDCGLELTILSPIFDHASYFYFSNVIKLLIFKVQSSQMEYACLICLFFSIQTASLARLPRPERMFPMLQQCLAQFRSQAR